MQSVQLAIRKIIKFYVNAPAALFAFIILTKYKGPQQIFDKNFGKAYLFHSLAYVLSSTLTLLINITT